MKTIKQSHNVKSTRGRRRRADQSNEEFREDYRKTQKNEPLNTPLFQSGWDIVPLLVGFTVGLCLGHSMAFLWRVYHASRIILRDPTVVIPLLQQWADRRLVA